MFWIFSDLCASREALWRHATSPEGVNYEMAPLLRMTFPTTEIDLAAAWAPGKKLFRSWMLVGGILPVEYDDLTFIEVEPGYRFLERSQLLTQRVWEHERTLTAIDGGCRLTDRIAFEPRLGLPAALFLPTFRLVFGHRHRRLKKRFGELERAETTGAH